MMADICLSNTHAHMHTHTHAHTHTHTHTHTEGDIHSPFLVLSLAIAEGTALVKYWCMLKRKEETRSLSGMVVEIMVLGVRGHEIPRCCARSNACVVW